MPGNAQEPYDEPPLSQCPEPIAIVGIGCRLPGNSSSPSALWDLLKEKRSGYCRIPSSRWNIDAFHHPNKDRPGSLPMDGGYFLDEDPRSFDPSFFNIRPQEAKTLDPQQRKLMEVVYESFESGGIPLEKVSGTNTGVFVGSFTWDYHQMISRDPEYPPDYAMTGSTLTILSNRINYVFNLKGPSLTLDTACSSSLYSLHLACDFIRSGGAGAVVAGSNIILNVEHQIQAAKIGVLSSSGKCHTFDSKAQGYGRGEGVAAVYLKKLSDALADGDPIRGVIRGSAVNANGRTAGITHPSREGQRAVIEAAYKNAGNLNVNNTGYFECHGTGTPVGDPLEVSAVSDVFAQGRSAESPLLIGSVKTNLGHTEPTSGLVGLIKAALALEHGQIPATLGYETPNPRILFDEWKVKVVTETTPWPSSFPLRRASINSFGYGGANAHVILEAIDSVIPGYSKPALSKLNPDYRWLKCELESCATSDTDTIFTPTSSIPDSQEESEHHSHLLTFSAHDEGTLDRNIRAVADVASKYESRDLSYTLGARRSAFHYRGFAVASESNLSAALDTDSIVYGQKRKNTPRIAFVFTGQGAQWPSMGRMLLRLVPAFRRTIQELDATIQALSDAPQWTLEETLCETGDCINEVERSQPICTAIQIALVDLLRSWGIQPVATVGHSSGEIAAAYTAGYLSASDAIVAAFYRGHDVSVSTACGSMLAVGLPAKKVEFIIAMVALDQMLVVACHNSPDSTTVSGDDGAIDRLSKFLTSQGTFNRKLKTGGRAYHSPHMTVVGFVYEEHLQAMMKDETLDTAGLPMASSVTGEMVQDGSEIGPTYWRRNLESPVLFSQALRKVLSSKDLSVDTVIEIGPHSALSGPIRDIATDLKIDPASFTYMPTLLREKNDLECLLRLAGLLFNLGYDVNLAAVATVDQDPDAPRQAKVLVDLPCYQWDHSTLYWTESRWSKEWRFREHRRHDILGSRIPGGIDKELLFRNVLRVKNIPWLEDHQIGTEIVFPAAGYIAQAVEAATQAIQDHNKSSLDVLHIAGYSIRNLHIKAALQLPHDDRGVETLVSFRHSPITRMHTSKTYFEFVVKSISEDIWTEHAAGEIVVETRKRNIKALFDSSQGIWKDLKSDYCYRSFSKAGLNYGPTFSGIEDIRCNAREKRATGLVTLSPSIMPHESDYAVHPATIDNCLQLALAALNPSLKAVKGFLPVLIKELSIWRTPSELTGFGDIKASGRQTGLRAVQINTQLVDVDGNIIMDARNIRCLAVDAGQNALSSSIAMERAPYFREVWNIDPDSLGRSQADAQFPPPMSMGDAEEKFEAMDRFLLLSMAQIAEEFPTVADGSGHLAQYHGWILQQLHGSPTVAFSQETLKDVLQMDARSRTREFEKMARRLCPLIPEAKLIYRLHQSMATILTGETFALNLMIEGDVLTEAYERGIGHVGAHQQIENICKLLGHKSPQMDVLEIGAGTGATTKTVLRALDGSADFRKYNSYTFTDISAGFFAAAAERFQDCRAMSYKALNIEKDLAEQGFADLKYDLVVASNVLHATESIAKTLGNIRSLLKPGGRLLLTETTKECLIPSYIWGTLSGFWLGADDGRVHSPFLAVEGWNDALRAAGFSGVDMVLKDYPEPYALTSTMLSKVSEDNALVKAVVSPEHRVLCVIHRREPAPLSKHIVDRALRDGFDVMQMALGTGTVPEGARCIVAAELEGALLMDITARELEAIKALVERASVTIWLTQCGILHGTEPEYSSTWGLMRALRTENPSLRLYNLDVDKHDQHVASTDVVFSVLRNVITSDSKDYQLIEKDGCIHCSRILPDDPLNDAFTSTVSRRKELLPFNSFPSLKLDIETVGMFDSLYFKEDERLHQSLPPTGVEVRTAALGMNMKDLLNLMGKVDQQFFCCEGSGVVTRVGSAVSNLSPGDRVAYLMDGDYGTYNYTDAAVCHRIEDEYSFEEMASVPVVYSTVYESLINVARLSKGESILIHAAAGGVGVAAIEVSKLLGAEIFATVSSQHKRDFLRDFYGIPDDHIFSSRDTSFSANILELTAERGVDVVLNSTIHELLHESLRCLGPFGRHVEIGKMDSLENGKVDLGLFERGITFAHVDLFQLYLKDKARVGRVLADVMRLLRERKIRPVRPVKTFEISEIEKAMRYFMEGKHIGKVVITAKQPEACVQVLRSQTSVQFQSDATYFLVGGLGGLGRSLISWMAERGASSFLMLSPSGKDKPAAARLVRELTIELEVDICVVKGDVTKLEDVERAIRSSPSPIKGVIHAAMVLRDGIFRTMSVENFQAVMGPKVLGALNLHKAFSNTPLDFFVMTSSLSAVLGTPAQSNYSAANAVLDAMARYRHSLGLPASSVALTRIDEVGYVSERADVAVSLSRKGMYGIDESEFLSSMEVAMQPFDSSKPAYLITGLEPSRIHSLESSHFDGNGLWATDARFGALITALQEQSSRSAVATADHGPASAGTQVKLLEQICGSDGGCEILLNAFVGKVSKVLLVPAERIDEGKTLAKYGMDSMVGAEIRSWFWQEVRVDVPFLELLSPTVTISGLVERVWEKIER